MCPQTSAPLGIGLIGAGAVSEYHHVPALLLDPRAELVAVCDLDSKLLERRREEWSVRRATTDPIALCADPRVDAVVLATPNDTHLPLTLAAIAAGKHVLCEKPLGLSALEARRMYRAARDARLVHMTAFTYRFAPAMRYLGRLVQGGSLGTPRHFRSQRLLDWPETSWGWRQYRASAGAGNLFDMTIHRIDFALALLGPLNSVCGAVAQFASREQSTDGADCAPSEVDDWSAILGEFASGAVGVWEGTTLAKGYHRGGLGHDWAEVNGSEGTAVYRLHEPNVVLIGKSGEDLKSIDVPADLLKASSSPRDPRDGEPATVFRYDVMWEFISAIVESRAAVPSFYEGLKAQVVADAVLESYARRAWVDIPPEAP